MFRRVAAGSHADLLTIERVLNEKTKRMQTQIAVEDVRKITGFMSLTPAEGGWRVVVVDGAEDLNQASANALLKILEEPPPRAILLLVCAAPGRLLPTIRSRCRRLRLTPLADEPMAATARPVPAGARSPTNAAGWSPWRKAPPAGRMMLAEDEGLKIAAAGGQAAGRPARPVPISRGYEIADFAGPQRDRVLDVHGPGARRRGRRGARSGAGRADPEQERLVALRPLGCLGRNVAGPDPLQDETERFALDKRQAIVAGIGMLSGTV